MIVKELKDFLNTMEDDNEVCIRVNEPAGWICPDGATVNVKRVVCGFDWHQNQVLIVPENELDIHNIEEWGRQQTSVKVRG